jgi:hypothetical protein
VNPCMEPLPCRLTPMTLSLTDMLIRPQQAISDVDYTTVFGHVKEENRLFTR